MKIEDNNKEIFENKFMNSFGMTIDQFERLDFEKQEELIKKVTMLNRKKKYLFKLKEILERYPIFKKTSEERKKLIKK